MWHDLWERHVAALALRVESTEPLALPAVFAALALHLLGLAAFWRYYHQPVWLAVPTLLVSLTLPFAALRFRRTLAIETLVPLFFLYLVLIARVIAVEKPMQYSVLRTSLSMVLGMQTTGKPSLSRRAA